MIGFCVLKREIFGFIEDLTEFSTFFRMPRTAFIKGRGSLLLKG